MKQRKLANILFVSLLGLLLLFPLGMNAQSKKEAKAAAEAQKKQEIAQLLDSGTFTITIDKLLPMRGGIRNLTPSYSFSCNDNKVNTYLPYVGSSHSAPMNPSELSIELKDKEVEISKKETKKGWEYSFQTRIESGESASFTLSVSQNGYVNIQLNCGERDSISYSGELVLPTK